MESDPRIEALHTAMSGAVAKILRAVGNFDNQLVMVLGSVLRTDPPGLSNRLASQIVFSHGTLEKRIDITRKLMMSSWLADMSKHRFYKDVDYFALDCFNKACKNVTDLAWVRNMAAHGNVMPILKIEGDDRYYKLVLIPAIFDYEGTARFSKKRQVPEADAIHAGLTSNEINQYAAAVSASNSHLDKISKILDEMVNQGATEKLQQLCSELGRDLKIRAPLLVRPHRTARPKRGPKT